MSCKNLLIVDDSETFCLMVKATLPASEYRVVIETDARQVMKLLSEGDFDAVLLDLMMPEIFGLELLDRIRKHHSVLPVVVVSGHGDDESILDAMRRGATDFVSKPIDGPLLDLRICRAIDLEQARRLANTDGLTGLYNHRYLQERLQQEIKRAERYRRHLSLVMADLDHFKRYNDAYGHPRGDQVLIDVAETLRHIGRSCDVVARYGGEEFTLILPETPADEALILAERARECIEALDVRVGDVVVTISLGIASLSPGATKEELFEAADSALYRAKHEGRNRVCVADDPEPKERLSPFAGAFVL